MAWNVPRSDTRRPSNRHDQFIVVYRHSLMGELDAMINPPQPQPQPEPEVIIEQPAEETGRLDYPRLHSWW